MESTIINKLPSKIIKQLKLQLKLPEITKQKKIDNFVMMEVVCQSFSNNMNINYQGIPVLSQ